MQHYIADLGPTYPCHPMFDSDQTWFSQDDDKDDWKSIRNVLDGLSEAGFNAIRLPMWPVSDEIGGRVFTQQIGASSQNFTRDECNQLSTNILSVLRNHTLAKPDEDNTTYYDDNFYYFKVYWSPAYEARQYQESMKELEYASWVLDHVFESDIEIDFMSPFSGNPSTMATGVESSDVGADRNTLFEMEVLKIISSTFDRYVTNCTELTSLEDNKIYNRS